MPQEAFCPEHGPYDASLGACPHPHGTTTIRPGLPTPYENDLPTELPAPHRRGRGVLDSDEEEATELPIKGNTMPQEAWCPEHGPYDGLGACPYPHAGPPPRPPMPTNEDVPEKKFRTERKNIGLRVFVSSTYMDLKEYREVVFKAVHDMLGYSDDMLFWSADDRDPLTVSIDRVKQCDLVILLVAHRYGYVPTGQKYSVTESEYRAAKDANIPVLAFFVDGEAPWPPKYFEPEQKEQLAKFRQLVEADVVRKTFRSTDELLALVTQALHHFIERRREGLNFQKQFRTTILTKSHIELTTSPDLVLQIGKSEDGIPLLLNIKRSSNLSAPINDLANLIKRNSYDDSADILLDNFRDQLERYAAKAWAGQQILSVENPTLKNSEVMYVTKGTLSELTSSLLCRIFSNIDDNAHTKNEKSPSPFNYYSTTLKRFRKKVVKRDKEPSSLFDDSATDVPIGRSSPDSNAERKLESAGGTNRFLGISSNDGQVYSVGMRADKWVIWHPFVLESIVENFPTCKIQVDTEEEYMSSYVAKLEDHSMSRVDDKGFLYSNIELCLSRQSIAQVILKIAETVDNFHKNKKVHGDLKPNNILLTKDGPILIDDLNLNLGEISHGWTPNWSAPEQVLQEPITYAADIYPLGLMVVGLISGRLSGEVKKFKIPTVHDPEKEHNVFYNPSVSIQNSGIIKHGSTKWISFAKSCLQFDSTKRPQSVKSFIQQLESLLKSHPLNGDLKVKLDKGQLVVATLLDGSKKVARLISDHE